MLTRRLSLEVFACLDCGLADACWQADDIWHCGHSTNIIARMSSHPLTQIKAYWSRFNDSQVVPPTPPSRNALLPTIPDTIKASDRPSENAAYTPQREGTGNVS